MAPLALALLLAAPSFADMGPKPELYIRLAGPLARGARVDLLECKDRACKDARPLEGFGPQGFGCCSDGCYGTAYGFAPYSRLRVQREGRTMLSNVFASPRSEGFYELRRLRGKLVVRSSPPFSGAEQRRFLECKLKSARPR